LGGAGGWAAGDSLDGFGQGGGEQIWLGIGGLDVFAQLDFELLHRRHLDVALLAHGHASDELALQGTELGWPQAVSGS
jgi:hypothetical protein